VKALESLFGQSPFALLQSHMLQVSRCVEAMDQIFKSLPQSLEILQLRAQEVSELEHLADLTKSQITQSLSSSLFMPVNKDTILEALAFQDGIADTVEALAHMFSFHSLETSSPFGEDFKQFFKANRDTFLRAKALVQEYDALESSSFGGCEAEKVDVMIEEVAICEHNCRLKEYELLRQLYAQTIHLSYGEFDLWQRVIRHTGRIAFQSEKLVYRIRRMLNP
jgi:predicted phosphate transport protein (TIGR00153 family)